MERGNASPRCVDGVSVEEFDKDAQNNLYKLWNGLSSGSYFPPPVKAVEIPKSGVVVSESWQCPLLRTG